MKIFFYPGAGRTFKNKKEKITGFRLPRDCQYAACLDVLSKEGE